ncbi:MAG: DUF58 domain-containing protein [Chromatiaceae bacterium]|nr:DUF58 domain-containing protein [Chromatiaceae bacterium]
MDASVSKTESNPHPSGQGLGLHALLGLRVAARRLDLAPRGSLQATRSGGHLARFRGRGMEFDESRRYQPGDDPRRMDWRLSARSGEPHVKLFREERERPLWLLVDQGPAMRFGTRAAFKSVLAAEAAALLGWAALEAGDRVGGLVFDEADFCLRQPAPRSRAWMPLLHALAQARPPGLAPAPGRLAEMALKATPLVRPGALVIVLSDFAGIGEHDRDWLARLGRGGEMLWVAVRDRLEAEPPPPGRYPLCDPAGRVQWLDLRTPKARVQWAERCAERAARLDALARALGAHLIWLTTGETVASSLAAGLATRPLRASRAGGGR